MLYGEWEPVIGLEIHAQLKTMSKVFASDSAEFGGGDNEHIGYVTMALPGTLPVLNRTAVEQSIKVGLALNSKINQKSIFARKNYFYPDMPKGYQISQYEDPLCLGGYVEFYFDGDIRKVNLVRAHMEEDAGKSTHHGQYSLINLNRAGVPLLEIVSEPEIRSPLEASEYARTIRSIVRYLDVCDGNLEQGSMRCDCNISVRRQGQQELGTKVEIKNVNSFRFVEKSIDYEIRRQISVLESGGNIVQETRLYDSTKNTTVSMRKKEMAQDYRYFPDPDLVPLKITNFQVEKIKSDIPELPTAKAQRFINQIQMSEKDALYLVQDKDLADFFEVCLRETQDAKSSLSWVLGDFLRMLNESKLEVQAAPVSAENMAKLIDLVNDRTISGKIAKEVFQEMWSSQQDPKKIIEDKGWAQITNESQVKVIVEEVLRECPEQVCEYKSGKIKVKGFLVGKIMQKTKGQASPEVVNRLLNQLLGDQT